MKNIKNIIISIGVITTFGFKIGDEIELTQFLNARSHPNFIKKTNVVKTLNAGTTGEVSDIKRFYSGNFGFKMKITNGPHAGETHWVYYNKSNPAIVLTTKKGVEIPEEKVDEKIVEEENVNSKVEEKINGHQDPSESILTDITEFPKITQATLDDVLKPKTIDCYATTEPEIVNEDIAILDVNLDSHSIVNSDSMQVQYQNNVIVTPLESNTTPETEVTKLEDPNSKVIVTSIPENTDPEITRESLATGSIYDVLAADPKQRPTNPFDYPRCGNKITNDFTHCFVGDQLEQINLHNSGPNTINPDGNYHINRHFNITYNDKSLSDATLMITDNPNEKVSASTYSVMMHFPRKQLPIVKDAGDHLEMTLANGEKVKFDKNSKQIIGGVFTEGPIKTDARRKALPADVKYSGSGVMIRADRNNGLPNGNDEDSRGREIPNRTVAVVSKKGHKDCKIPSDQLWYNDKKLNRVLIKEEYSTDEGLDKLLQSRCGFTIN